MVSSLWWESNETCSVQLQPVRLRSAPRLSLGRAASEGWGFDLTPLTLYLRYTNGFLDTAFWHFSVINETQSANNHRENQSPLCQGTPSFPGNKSEPSLAAPASICPVDQTKVQSKPGGAGHLEQTTWGCQGWCQPCHHALAALLTQLCLWKLAPSGKGWVPPPAHCRMLSRQLQLGVAERACLEKWVDSKICFILVRHHCPAFPRAKLWMWVLEGQKSLEENQGKP